MEADLVFLFASEQDAAMSTALRSVGPMSPEGMDRPRSSQDFAAVQLPPWNEVLLSGMHRSPLSVGHQGVAALHHNHVFVVVVCVGSRDGILVASPKRHLAAIRSVEHVPLNSRSRLRRLGNPVPGFLHEVRKVAHNCCHSLTLHPLWFSHAVCESSSARANFAPHPHPAGQIRRRTRRPPPNSSNVCNLFA
jgi:hypothetical protein